MKSIEILYIFAFVACFIGNCACISSGTSVTNEYGLSYQASVQCPVIMCSGAIVSSKSVLTTTTCINGLQPGEVEVVVGSNKYYSGGFIYDVAIITTHPNFNSLTYDNNIAVLTLTNQITTANNIAAIPLATAQPAISTVLTASAFGATNAAMSLPNTLQRANLVALGTVVCQVLKANKLTANMFCAGDALGNRDLCPADQGAPLVYNSKLYGIYSWGGSCGLAAPSSSSPVFNLISVLSPWIESTIAANES